MNMTMSRHGRRAATGGAVALAATATVLALAAPAQAHVTIDPGEAEQGGYDTINVKVPNERDNASTVRLELHLDPDHPLASAMPQPVPGWDVSVKRDTLDEPIEVHGSEITEAPATITWTATGDGIQPGTFQQFPISVGPLPEDADRLVFDAIQTYDNDEIVRWIEEPVEGQPEPELPSPVLELTAADEPADEAADDEADAKDDDGDDGDDKDSSAASDGTARALGAVGIALGAAGLAFGVLARRRAS